MTRTRLHERTIELLEKDNRSTLQISQDSGLPYHWLAVFRRGSINSPSVDRVVALYEHLSKTKLEVS